MKLRAFAVIAALALPGLASATPADRPPINPPTTNPPATNPPSDQPTPDQAPADKPMTDADRQDDKDMTATMARIKTLKGAEFDKQYINMMVAGHDKELSKIDVAISGAGDADLKTMLQGVKPVLQRHADQARDLQKSPQAALEPSKPMDPNKPVDKLPSQR